LAKEGSTVAVNASVGTDITMQCAFLTFMEY
jgi:hypothetical protein